MLTAEEIKKVFRLCTSDDGGYNCTKCPANGHGLPCSEVAMAAGFKYIELLEQKLEDAENEIENWENIANKLERRLEEAEKARGDKAHGADQRARAELKLKNSQARGWIEGIK
jgi:glutamate-1-semialdehyde aminotransferase